MLMRAIDLDQLEVEERTRWMPVFSGVAKMDLAMTSNSAAVAAKLKPRRGKCLIF